MLSIKVSLFLSIKALESLLRSKTYRNIIINRDVRIYLDASANEVLPFLERPDENYIGAFLRHQCKGEFYLANELVNNLLGSPDLMCQYPYSVFILDISPSDAKMLRERYGILCYSDKFKPRFPQLRYRKSVFCKSNSYTHSWESIFKDLSVFPRNTIIINDRYLLGSLSDYSVDSMKGNLGEIMTALLPSPCFLGTAYVLVIFDAIDNSWSKQFTEHADDYDPLRIEEDFYVEAQKQFEERSRRINDVIRNSSKGKYPIKTICVSFFRA